MLIIQKKFGIPIRKYYFSQPDSPGWVDYLLPTAYMDCYSPTCPRFFQTEYRHTLLTDLTPEEERIFQHFSKDARSQIRRGEQDGRFSINMATRLEDFIPLYNAFADSRGMSLFTVKDAEAIGTGQYCLFSSDYQGRPVICHLYLVSPATGTVNLLISASSLAYRDNEDMRRASGFANRCLHWQGMRHFKAHGYHTYDWGGYVQDASEPMMQGINRFKRTFNGTLTPIFNYYSPCYAFIEKLRHKLRR
ncbi:MAG: GNAT family N-acetyltransferase [Candidatus Thiothrix moscowensis]|nr:GNAT family N-acetyltransferase [Candidatus Thiothrix moscowensis]